MVEKDYWVTHTLWALHHQGFEVWFKGGTSLSKGIGIFERFSEDIDARIDAGRTGLTDPALSWTNRKRGIAERDEWFDAIAAHLDVLACEVDRDPAGSDNLVRSASFTIRYQTLLAHLRHPPPRATRETDRQPPVDRDPASDLAVDRPG